MNIHEKYINRCIQLARNGLGRTYPNPMVGSVIVHDETIIGEGWHQKAGLAHAEVNAVNSVIDQSRLKDSTIYVSLEPCSHFGKTPPCSDLIIARGIKRVVIGTMDPFAEVAGRGIKKLMEAGCEVKVGVLEKECIDLNKRFFTFHQKKRPYIILKWAQSEDRFLAPENKDKRRPVWITNSYSAQLNHRWRSEEMAILVGSKTVIEDDPKLNVRNWTGSDPLRVIIDPNLDAPENSSIFDGSQQTLIICETNHSEKNSENVTFRQIDFSAKVPQQICEILYENGFQSVIIEGGAFTLNSFLNEGLWDEARVFTGAIQLKNGIKAPISQGKLAKQMMLENDELKIYRND